MAYKITLIGGGSSTFTPQLMRLFLQSDVLQGSTIALMDVDNDRLEVMDQLCKGLVASKGASFIVESTTDRTKALEDANFVITAISVGGFDAWEIDIELPAKFGIYMPIADSIGPGGIMRAFRHIPPLVEVCRELESVSPEAIVFNYSNPASVNCRAMREETDIEVISLCTCSAIPRDANILASFAKVDPSEIVLPAPVAGINHCACILDLKLKDGTSAFNLIRENETNQIIQWGLQNYGILPYCWFHWLEFYPSLCKLGEPYQGRLQGLRMKYGRKVHDMRDERARAEKWESLVNQWSTRTDQIDFIRDLPSGEHIEVVAIIEALVKKQSAIHVVNVPNKGAIENLPDDAIVEVTANVGGYGIQPLHVGALPGPVAATIQYHLNVQDLTMQAALSGDKEIALRAFLQDPQVASVLTPQQAAELLDQLLEAHADYLPQFS